MFSLQKAICSCRHWTHINHKGNIHINGINDKSTDITTDDIALKRIPSKFPFLRNFRIRVKAFENDSPDKVIPA